MRCLTLAVLLLAGGCNRAKPSLEYAEASGQHSILVARLGDDAYADDEMARVEELLRKVPSHSTDAAAAAQLLELIASERRRIAAEAAAHQRELDAVGRVLDVADSPRPPEAAGPAPEAAPDAGGGSWELTAGMTADELKKVSGDCFSSAGPIKLRKPDGSDLDGELYERRESEVCRGRYAQYGGRVLVFRDGKLAGNFGKNEVQREPAPRPAPPTAPQAPGPVLEVPRYPGAPAPGTPTTSPGEQTGPAP